MAVFNTNQNRHLYVAKSYAESVNDASATGAIVVDSTENGLEKDVFFKYKGADTVLRSDLIPVQNINYVKAVKAADLAVPLKKVTVTLDSEVNGGAVISGEDYVLRVIFRQFFGMSDEDVYVKDVAVHGTTGMTAEKFYTALKDALNLAFSRELGANATSNPYLTFTASASGLVIEEKEQEWTLGTQSQERVYFDIQPTTVYVDNQDSIWGVVEVSDSDTTIKNGKKIADLEYFCMGERGDQYRMIGFPNYIPTTYLVDPSKEYNVLEIHYAFTDTGVNSYRSEKDITIVAEDAAVINSIISAINSAANLEVATLE